MNQFRSMVLISLLWAFSTLGVWSNAQDKQVTKKKEKPMIECRIITKTDAVGAGKLIPYDMEIKNVSEKPFAIRYTRNPLLENLVIDLKTPDGKTSRRNCGDHLSPLSPNGLLHTILPGGSLKEVGGVGDHGPGIYRIQATFEYENTKAVSPVVEIELKVTKEK